MNDLYDLILSSHGYLSSFDRKGYPVCFEKFETAVKGFFDSLEDGTAEAEAGALMEKFSSRYGSVNKREKKELLYKDKQILALFLTPAAIRYGGAAASFSEHLRELWKAQFPKEPYNKGDYESIMRGFEGGFMGFFMRR